MWRSQPPGVHWSELPKLRAQYADRIDASLQQSSLPGWFLEVFFFEPGRRWIQGRPKTIS